MTVHDLAMNQPAVTVEEIDDPTEAGAGIELLELDAVQLKSMRLRARRVVVRLEACVVVFHSTNARLRTRTSVHEDLLAYVTFGPQAHGTVNGLTVLPGLMLAAEPGAEARFVAEAGWQSVTFLVRAQDIRAHLVARRREEDLRVPSGVEILQVNAERVRDLYDWGRRLVDVAAREPSTFNDGRKERVVAQVELIESLLATLGGASDFEPTRSERTRQAHSLIVKVAEDHALSRLDDHLYVTDLCRAAEVSERTLEYAFKEIMGLTPMNYLVRLRLHRVRQALLAATQGSSTVSVEALKWGLWHFGEFSRAYRECFGELPSDTLCRPPGEMQPEADIGSSATSR
jgi:AraC family transcriptional regulator, ethanolamine operon transcriptional activator